MAANGVIVLDENTVGSLVVSVMVSNKENVSEGKRERG